MFHTNYIKNDEYAHSLALTNLLHSTAGKFIEKFAIDEKWDNSSSRCPRIFTYYINVLHLMMVDVIKRLLSYRGTKVGSGFYQTRAYSGNGLIGSDYINKRGTSYLPPEIFSSLMLMDIHLLSTYRII